MARRRLPGLAGGPDEQDRLAVRRKPRMSGSRTARAVLGQRVQVAAVRLQRVQLAPPDVEVVGRGRTTNDQRTVRGPVGVATAQRPRRELLEAGAIDIHGKDRGLSLRTVLRWTDLGAAPPEEHELAPVRRPARQILPELL